MKIVIRLAFLLCTIFFGSPLWAQPTANFSANVTVGCAPLLVQFTNTSTGGATSWSWNFGNSATSVIQNPSTTYTTPGTYTVTLTATNASGSNTKTMTAYITVYGGPQVSFTADDTAGCPPHTVNFTNSTNLVTPGTGSYSWVFGDGNSSTLENPSHTYQLPGYYNVTLIATNSGGCTQSLTKPAYIHVYEPPVADFSVPNPNFCITPGIAAFTPNVTGVGPFTYAWNFGDNTTSSASSPTHTYPNAGGYTVTLIVTDSRGCKDTMIKPNYITVSVLNAAFSMPPSACVNTQVPFTNSSAGASGSIWYFGDGGSFTGTNAVHTYTTAGTFNVMLVAGSGTCLDTQITPITIYPAPNIDFTATPIEPCPAPATIQFTNATTGGTSYTWFFGDGGSSTQTNPSHTYANNGIYTVTLVATSGNGCTDTLVKPQYMKIYDWELDAGASPYQGCVPLEVNFSSANYTHIPSSGSPYPYSSVAWSWTFGDGGTSMLENPVHTYTTTGNFTVTLTATSSNGCVQIDTIHVLVGTLPTAMFTSTPDTICVDEDIHFTNSSTGATSYIWDFGDGGASASVNPNHPYATSGSWVVTLHAYNNGCEGSYTDTVPIIVHPPTTQFIPLPDCADPRLVNFLNTSLEPTSNIWIFGDGFTSTASAPTHTYPALGSYNVTLITFNNIYGCSDTNMLTINLIDPVAGLTADDTAVCKGDTVHFTSSFTGMGVRYDWQIGTTYIPDTSVNMTWGFADTGNYKVSVFITDMNICTDTATINVIVGKPDANFVASPTVGCTPLSVIFTDQSTDVSGSSFTNRTWTFGNGGTASTSSATASSVYGNPGFYDVQLIVTDNIGCKDTMAKAAYIEARKPNAAFAANDTAVCIGQAVNFSNGSTGSFLTAAWTFGDGGTSSTFSPSHAYAATGNYTVRLIVTDASGCKDTMERLAYINITKPDAGFTMSDTFNICPPMQVFFTDNSTGGSSYLWNFGDGSGSTLSNPDNAYTVPGLFTISQVVTNGQGCKDTAYGTANVLGYAGGLSYTPLAGCAPLDVQFTATLTNVPSIVWDFSDGVTAPVNGSSTTTHTYLTPGAYVPKLILSDGAGCLNSSDGLDTIKVDGILGGFDLSPACEKTTVQFQDTSFSFFSPVTTWAWDFNNGAQTSTISNPTYYYPTPGTYPITLIVTNAHGCKDTVTTNLTINPLPVIGAGPDTSICPGDAAQLAGEGGVSYVWSPAATLSCTACPTPSATPVVTTPYMVVGTDINGCENVDSVVVNVQYITTSEVGDGGEICDDSSFQLMATGAHRYEWSPSASLDNYQIANPMASPHETTIYTVKAWEGSCPPDSHTVKIIVFPLPTVDAGSDQTIIAGASTMIQATGTLISTFIWSPVEHLSCTTCSNPTANPFVTTTYRVTGITNYGCKSSDTVTIHVLCDQSQLFIPNTFTPNGDGQNDVFYARGEGLKEIKSIRIYDRWGELMYERRGIGLNDKASAWDGTYKGTALNPDTYVYVIEGTCNTGESVNWKGDVTLIR